MEKKMLKPHYTSTPRVCRRPMSLQNDFDQCSPIYPLKPSNERRVKSLIPVLSGNPQSIITDKVKADINVIDLNGVPDKRFSSINILKDTKTKTIKSLFLKNKTKEPQCFVVKPQEENEDEDLSPFELIHSPKKRKVLASENKNQDTTYTKNKSVENVQHASSSVCNPQVDKQPSLPKPIENQEKCDLVHSDVPRESLNKESLIIDSSKQLKVNIKQSLVDKLVTPKVCGNSKPIDEEIVQLKKESVRRRGRPRKSPLQNKCTTQPETNLKTNKRSINNDCDSQKDLFQDNKHEVKSNIDEDKTRDLNGVPEKRSSSINILKDTKTKTIKSLSLKNKTEEPQCFVVKPHEENEDEDLSPFELIHSPKKRKLLVSENKNQNNTYTKNKSFENVQHATSSVCNPQVDVLILKGEQPGLAKPIENQEKCDPVNIKQSLVDKLVTPIESKRKKAKRSLGALKELSDEMHQTKVILNNAPVKLKAKKVAKSVVPKRSKSKVCGNSKPIDEEIVQLKKESVKPRGRPRKSPLQNKCTTQPEANLKTNKRSINNDCDSQKDLFQDNKHEVKSNIDEDKARDVKKCFGLNEPRITEKEGALVQTLLHINNLVMTGMISVPPGGVITQSSTNTTYFVTSGSANVRIGPLSQAVSSESVNCSFFIPKLSDFSISNEEEVPLKMYVTKFTD